MNIKKLIAALAAAAVLVAAVLYGTVYGGKIKRTADPEKTVTSSGSYTFSGKISEKIKIEAAPSDDVEIILDGAQISNPDGPCIKVTSAAGVTLVLAEGSENFIYSGNPEDPTGQGSAINCDCSLYIRGKGDLTVYGYNNNGIHSSGNIIIEEGNITVFAAGDCIQADNDLTVSGGNITAGGNGTGAGSVSNDSGSFAGFTLSTQNAPDQGFDPGNGFGFGPGGDAGGNFDPGDKPDDIPDSRPDDMPDIPDGSFGGMPQMPNSGNDFSQGGFAPDGPGSDFNTGSESTSDSQKGLKAGNCLTVSGGNITVNTADDAIHCGGEMIISGGDLVLSSGDDGLHSDTSIVISEASIVINSSCEGIEANHITVNSGTVSLKASDDGFNANGGNNMFGFGGFGGFNGGNSGSGTDEDGDTPSLIFNGGTVYVDASGDGLDSNGDLIINGGTVIIDGPSSSMNGALDSGSENGGSLLVNGGTVLAVGAGGMAESPESESQQAFIYENISFQSGSSIIISGSNGAELLSHKTVRSGSNIIFSCPGLSEGDTVNITVDGSTTVCKAVKSAENAFGGFGGGFGGGSGRPGGGKKP